MAKYNREDNKVYNMVNGTLAKKFIHTEEVAMVIATALAAKENCILWGDGGYGKSEMVGAIINQFENIKKDHFIKSLTEETTIADLFGGVNLKKMDEEGVIEYNVENSFMNFTYVVFEEGLSVPPNVAAALRDIISSGWFRNGTQQFEIKTKVIIICTNVDPYEVASFSTSTEALMQRFPIVHKVEWPSHSSQDYKNLFQISNKNPNEETIIIMAELINNVLKGGDKVSPRTALKAWKLVDTQKTMRSDTKAIPEDFLILRVIPQFNKEMVNFESNIWNLKREAQIANNFGILKMRLDGILSAMRGLVTTEYKQYFRAEKAVRELMPELKSFQVSDKLFAEKEALVLEMETLANNLREKAMALVDAEVTSEVGSIKLAPQEIETLVENKPEVFIPDTLEI